MTSLTASPLNVVLDGRWNSTPAERLAGTSPRQLACNFATSGQVFVKQAPNALCGARKPAGSDCHQPLDSVKRISTMVITRGHAHTRDTS